MSGTTLAIGGIAAVAGIAAARLGAHVGFAGMVGDDEAGRNVRAVLDADGVDTALLRTVPGMPTPSCVIISDQTAGTRSILNHPGIASYKLPARADVASAAARAKYLHLDHTAFPALADEILPRCKVGGTLVSVDAGQDFPGIEQYLPLIDVYATTGRQLLTMTGESDLATAMRRVRSLGPSLVVATLGTRGCAGLLEDGSTIVVPGFVVPVVDTTGAGDVFHGALLYALLHGYELEAALRFSNAAAALSCGAVGGHPGCPRLDRVRALLESGGDRALDSDAESGQSPVGTY